MVTVAVVLISSSSTLVLADSATTGDNTDPGFDVFPAASVAVICKVLPSVCLFRKV
ncbi:hypothetical protein D3C72_2265690 [compost metagenome]